MPKKEAILSSALWKYLVQALMIIKLEEEQVTRLERKQNQ